MLLFSVKSKAGTSLGWAYHYLGNEKTKGCDPKVEFWQNCSWISIRSFNSRKKEGFEFKWAILGDENTVDDGSLFDFVRIKRVMTFILLGMEKIEVFLRIV